MTAVAALPVYRSQTVWQGQTPDQVFIRVRVQKTSKTDVQFLTEKLDKAQNDWVPAGVEEINTLAKALVITNGNVPNWARVAM